MTPIRWKARLSTASSWSDDPAAWPVSATGSNAASDRTASQPTVVCRVATAAPVATTAATSALMSSERRRSMEVMKLPSWVANAGSLGAVPARRA